MAAKAKKKSTSRRAAPKKKKPGWPLGRKRGPMPMKQRKKIAAAHRARHSGGKAVRKSTTSRRKVTRKRK